MLTIDKPKDVFQHIGKELGPSEWLTVTQEMIDTLTWLIQAAGSDSGGFFATHPGTEDRIAALKKVSAR